jgi:drug/metabolite transporter (DMT)-like permease
MQKRSLIMALAAAALFGAATPISKILLDGVSPQLLAGLLYLGAALGVLPLVLRLDRRIYPWHYPLRSRWLLLGAILFGGMLGPLFLLLGLRQASAGSVAIWLNLEAVATVLLGYFLFRDQLDRWGWLGALCMILASMLLSWGEGSAGVRAGVLVALACTCWGLDNHFTALIDGITPAESTFWKGIVAGILNIVVALLLGAGQGVPSWQIIAGALVVGVFSYGFSIVLYIMAAQQTGATRSQLLFSTAPFWGVLLAVVLLGEQISPAQIGAGGLAIVSILLLSLERHEHFHHHQAIAHEHWHSHDDEHHTHDHVAGQFARYHSHLHHHEEMSHTHTHLPDLHHRHLHSATSN